MPTTYINFHAQVNPFTVQNLMTAISQKLASGTDQFYVMLSTPGGHVQSGITVYNFLRALPSRLTMHNIGNVDSIGNAIFLAADERIACAHSTFMFHGVGFDVQNLRVEEKNARELLHGILADQIRIADIIVARTAINRNRSRKLFREARTKNANEALNARQHHSDREQRARTGVEFGGFLQGEHRTPDCSWLSGCGDGARQSAEGHDRSQNGNLEVKLEERPVRK
jgi:ATP-dependent protease ClpP protease subunit